MQEEIFYEYKVILENFLLDRLVIPGIQLEEIKSLNLLLSILEKYNFDNRLKFKGLLSHTIIDSLDVDYVIGENCIRFDQLIN